MTVAIVVGAQWGDEGKGKVVDLYSENADAVVRYGGGANAGHTLVIHGQTLITHLIPSGVLHPGTQCVLGDGMVIDPHTLLAEIQACKDRGLLPDDELTVSERAHVILPLHRAVEALREARKHAIGTTGRGIGPAYEAKVARRGVRMRDLLRPERLGELIGQNLDELAPVIEHYGGDVPGPGQVQAMVAEAVQVGARLERYIGDAGRCIDGFIRAGKNVLFEGAQGTLLDIDQGTYPFVTSSTTVAAGACQGTGVGPTRIDRVIGIAKAYLTRVGGGPFPTELDDEDGARLRQAGGEFGATTGRPRRCGWLDLPALRLAVRVNGLAGLALTKLDVLTGRAQIQACTAYRLDGQLVDELPVDPVDIERAEPVFQSFPGWDRDIRHATAIADLPAQARAYIGALEDALGVPFYLVSVGPDRTQTIKLRDVFE
jgi:adenylosuccinate synthase